jgi:hypothetical protein
VVLDGWPTVAFFSVEMLKGVLGDGYATTTIDAGLGSVMDVSE